MRLSEISIGKMLASARVEAQISQAELAEQLGYSSPQYVSNWERDECAPPLEKLFEITQTLKIDRFELLRLLIEDSRNKIERLFE